MKSLKLKALITGCGFVICAVMALPGPSVAQVSSTSEKPLKYLREKSEINNDLARIKIQQQNINYLEAKYKKSKASGNESAQVANKKELARAKADLKRDKAYLRADKDELLYAYKLAIYDRRQEVKKDKVDLKTYREKLDKSLATGDEAVAIKYAAIVAKYNRELKNDKLALQNERKDRNYDLMAYNKKIEKYEGESRAVLYSENAVASLKNNVNFDKLLK